MTTTTTDERDPSCTSRTMQRLREARKQQALRKPMQTFAILSVLTLQLAYFASKQKPDIQTITGIPDTVVKTDAARKASSMIRPSRLTPEEITDLFSIPNTPSNKPKIRTFFHDIGMDNTDIYNQLKLWKTAWAQAGWDARILTLAHAQQHPQYNQLKARIDSFDTCVNHQFHKICFLRYIAAAADGDGWMADYDILPLHFQPTPTTPTTTTLPNNGKFTSHDAYLIAPMNSATSNELIRVLQLMIQTVEQHSTKRTRGTPCPNDSTKFQITDQESLLIITREINNGVLPQGTIYYDRPNLGQTGLVVRAEDLVEELERGGGSSNCFGDKKAMHFSARPDGLRRDGRYGYMLESWMKWKEVCKLR